VLISSASGIWSYDGDSWTKLSTYSGAKSLVSNADGVPYILDSNGHPLVWNGTSNVTGLPYGFNWAVPNANNNPGSGGSAVCPSPTELALGSGGAIWVIGCLSSDGPLIYGNTINSNYNWGTSYKVNTKNVLQSIGGNTLYSEPWTVDSEGLTYLGAQAYGQEWHTPYIQYTTPGAQVIGQWGNQPFAIAIPLGGLNGNGDYPVAYYTDGAWGWPYYSGAAHAVSVESYTSAALYTYSNDIAVITFD
jgi:hypothetical protein